MGEGIMCDKCLSLIPQGKEECPFCGNSFANTNPDGALIVGTLLCGYTVGKCIRKDSEGYIYTAIENETKVKVNIKEFAPEIFCGYRNADGGLVPKNGFEVLFKTVHMDFKEMYTLLMRLRYSKGLVQVLNVFDANGTSYCVTEDSRALSLQDYLVARHSIPTASEVLLLLRPVCEGVRDMHRIGIIHRGISPMTVFISDDGYAKLGGYATLGMRTKGSELECELFDGYSAPEQYAVAEFDGSYTDVYAMGALYYCMLTRTEPLSAFSRKQGETLNPIHKINTAVPSYLSSAISRAMRMAPHERMKTAEEFLCAVTTPQREDVNSNSKKLKKYTLIAIVALMVIIAMALFAAFYFGNAQKNNVIPSTSILQSSSIVSAGTIVPTFVGEKYSEIQSKQEYVGVFLFTVKEEFSTIFRKGEVMVQSVAQGTEIAKGATIELTVSKGPEVAEMPEVVGMESKSAQDLLNSLKIKFSVVGYENDGSFIPGTVAKTDLASGSIIQIDNGSVVLYIANESNSSSSLPTSTSLPASSSSLVTSSAAPVA